MNDFEIFQTLLGNLDCHESRINFITKIINTIPDPVFVKDREHRWLVLNDALCEFIGMPREALIGKTDYDFFPKEEADIFWQKDDEVFRTGQENINEESITDSNGVAHIFSTRKAIFQEQTTGQQFLVGTIRDYTELRKTEEKLKELHKEAERVAVEKKKIEQSTQFLNGGKSALSLLVDSIPDKEVLEAIPYEKINQAFQGLFSVLEEA